METVHLIGIGGSGMLPLAELLLRKGYTVTGSDRLLHTPNELDHLPPPIQKRLRRLTSLGATLFAQDGSGVTQYTDRIVISTAIEDTNPDLKKAKPWNIPIRHRAEELQVQIGNQGLIAITGTSGKTTTAALCAWILLKLGELKCFVGGAEILDTSEEGIGWSAVCVGDGAWSCAELDESDQSLLRFAPEIAVILNISRDHYSYEENLEIFERFCGKVGRLLFLNRCNPGCLQLADTLGEDSRIAWFTPPENVSLKKNGIQFDYEDLAVELPLLGRHNAENATAALSAVHSAVPNASKSLILEAVRSFPGVRRRLHRYGSGEITVYDDYAHNPEKLEALLQTLQQHYPRVFLVFQPHGYGPLRFHLEGYANVFTSTLREQDRVILLPVYDAGGTTDRSIASNDLAAKVEHPGIMAGKNRDGVLAILRKQMQRDDVVVVAGARDDTLADYAEQIARHFQ